MPTRSRRVLRRARYIVALMWWLGLGSWAVLILYTQRPWAGLNELQTTQWLIGGIGGILVGTLQKQGKDYWPANTMLGLAYGSDKMLYFMLTTLVFRGDSGAFRAWASASRVGVWAWAFSFALLAWGLYMVARVNMAKNGSSIDMLGRPRPPTEPQALEAAHVLLRASRHGTGNVLTRPEFKDLVEFIDSQRERTWFKDASAQLRFEEERAARRIAAARGRVAEGRASDNPANGLGD